MMTAPASCHADQVLTGSAHVVGVGRGVGAGLVATGVGVALGLGLGDALVVVAGGEDGAVWPAVGVTAPQPLVTAMAAAVMPQPRNRTVPPRTFEVYRYDARRRDPVGSPERRASITPIAANCLAIAL
jgi:hypothetical protein